MLLFIYTSISYNMIKNIRRILTFCRSFLVSDIHDEQESIFWLGLERKITISKAIQRLLQNRNRYFAFHWHRSLEIDLTHFTARPVATRRIDRNNYKK